MRKNKKKSLYEPRNLTYEEHKKISEFLKYFHDEGQKIFDLLRQSFGDYEEPIKNMAKAINFMSSLHQSCSLKCCHSDIIIDSDYEKWFSLYQGIGLWTTTGWK